MKKRGLITKLFVLASVASGFLVSYFSAAAMAQDAADMSCDELWYARNAIYARNGYCFQTPRAGKPSGRVASHLTASCMAGKNTA
jgi:hypothetical protein